MPFPFSFHVRHPVASRRDLTPSQILQPLVAGLRVAGAYTVELDGSRVRFRVDLYSQMLDTSAGPLTGISSGTLHLQESATGQRELVGTVRTSHLPAGLMVLGGAAVALGTDVIRTGSLFLLGASGVYYLRTVSRLGAWLDEVFGPARLAGAA